MPWVRNKFGTPQMEVSTDWLSQFGWLRYNGTLSQTTFQNTSLPNRVHNKTPRLFVLTSDIPVEPEP